MVRRLPSLTALVEGIRRGDRALLARGITLVESTLPAHQALAAELLTALMPATGGAIRVGITGVPGVGKSTLIDSLGTRLTDAGHRVAVLAVDPSSSRSGGSILGDKTRMERLSRDPRAFVRPSPTAGTLGGVATRTREAMLLCEAAGYDVVLVETVGVGQSEIVVAGMTDTFLVLMLSGAGDALQGIKRGLMEMADVLAVNKADGDNAARSRRAASTYRGALALLHPPDAPWKPEVMTCSGLAEQGLDDLWAAVLRHRAVLSEHGLLDAKRTEQQLAWMWRMVEDRLATAFRASTAVADRLPEVERAVRDHELPPTRAALELLRAFGL